MTLVLFLLALGASAPVDEAEALAQSKDAEQLFLKFASAKPDEYSAPERKRLAAALFKGASGARHDPMIAVALAERAAVLDKTPEALTLLGQIEMDLDQRSSAARHLDEAIALKAGHGPALVARAELAVKEQDFAVAVDRYQKAQAGGAAVGPALAKARASLQKKQADLDELKSTETQIQAKVSLAERNAARDWVRQVLEEDGRATERKRLAPDGVRKQEMAHFVFSYSAGNKNAGEMMDFESKVERVLNKTYDFIVDRLGHRLERRTPVVLLTRAEFMQKYSGTREAGAAGFWDGAQIVINGGAELNQVFAEVMVHEFTHAVVTDLAGRGAPRWLNEGFAENMRLSAIGTNGKLPEGERAVLTKLSRAGQLPKLAQLDAMLVGMGGDVRIAYALSGEAVRLLLDRRGYGEFLDMLRAMKRSGHPLKLVEQHLMPLDRLEDVLADALK
jgi:tetratricopeptide (TPR) repeat protein